MGLTVLFAVGERVGNATRVGRAARVRRAKASLLSRAPVLPLTRGTEGAIQPNTRSVRALSDILKAPLQEPLIARHA